MKYIACLPDYFTSVGFLLCMPLHKVACHTSLCAFFSSHCKGSLHCITWEGYSEGMSCNRRVSSDRANKAFKKKNAHRQCRDKFLVICTSRNEFYLTSHLFSITLHWSLLGLEFCTRWKEMPSGHWITFTFYKFLLIHFATWSFTCGPLSSLPWAFSLAFDTLHTVPLKKSSITGSTSCQVDARP